MSNLLYSSATDVLFTRAEMAHLPRPKSMGARHNPIPFVDYIDMVEHALDTHGIAVTAEEYALSKDKQRMFGMMEIEPKPLAGQLIEADDWSLNVGLRGSHDQKIPRGLTLGTMVMVCSNLAFHGDLGTFTTKQTTNILARLPILIEHAVEKIPVMAERQEQKFDDYKNKNVRPRAGDAFLVEVFRQGGLSSAQLGRAIAEWDNPSYAEHEELGWTAWRLMNACTEALKPSGANANMNIVRERSMLATRLLDEKLVYPQ